MSTYRYEHRRSSRSDITIYSKVALSMGKVQNLTFRDISIEQGEVILEYYLDLSQLYEAEIFVESDTK